MKNVVATVSIAAAVSCLGWCFGAGVMNTEAAAVLLTCWIGLAWSCLPE